MSENSKKPNDIKDLVKGFDVPSDWPGDLLAPAATDGAIAAIVLPNAPSFALPASTKDPAARFLTACDSARTQATMRESLARIERVLGAPAGSVPWAQLRAEHTSDIRARLIRQGYSARSVNVTLAALRGVLRAAFELELISGDDYTRAIILKNVKVDRTPAGRALPPGEASKIEAYCRTLGPEVQDWPESAYGAFLLAVFALMFGAGLRAAEVAALSLKAYDGGIMRVLGKGAKLRAVPLGDAEKTALEQWLTVRAELDLPPDAPLLVRVLRNGSVDQKRMLLNRKKLEHLCKAIARLAGVERYSPHDLRRTFCTEFLEAGADLATVQRIMGHKSPETTAIYDRRPEEKDAIARRKVQLLGREPFDAIAQRARVLAAIAKKR